MGGDLGRVCGRARAGPGQSQEASCAGFNLEQGDQVQWAPHSPISAGRKPRASAGIAASTGGQESALRAIGWVPLACPPAVEGLERPTAARRDRGGAGPSFSDLPLPALPQGASLPSRARHTQGAGWVWLLARGLPPWRQEHSEKGQHSTQASEGALPSEGRARDLSVGARERGREEKGLVNRGASSPLPPPPGLEETTTQPRLSPAR